jgi:lipid-A-disaccharide synthase
MVDQSLVRIHELPLIYLVAGEQSGDALGGRLMAALRTRFPNATFAGIGGNRMAAEGLSSLFPLEELALMGFLEVVPKLPLLRRRLAETVADIAARRPGIVVTIDSPGFSLRVLRAIAPLGVKRVHYVAPQVWAWRQGRVRRYPGLWDRLLCLLPFEPAFFARHGLPARFVGHPVLESGAGSGDPLRFRATHSIPPSSRILTVMPGSRLSEAARLLPVLGETMRRLPGIVAAVPLAGTIADAVRRGTASWQIAPLLIDGERDKHDAFAASAAALTKSGTSTLELALADVPMLVAYRVNKLTAPLIRRLVTVRHAALVNLLTAGIEGSGPTLIPELIQQDCTPENLARALRRLLDEPAAAAAQRTGFRQILASLQPPGGLLPSEAAAEAVLEILEQARGAHPVA